MAETTCSEGVPFQRPSIGKEEEAAVLSVMRSGWLTTASVTLEFEKEFSAFVDDPARRPVISLAVNSNTSGMSLAMAACGVAPGTAVITTPYTFVSTAACAAHLGAEVLFADTGPGSYNIDPDRIEELLAADTGRRIRAVVPVHICGNVCDMRRITELARRYNVKVIEDAAHSFPSRTELGHAGTIGDFGVFSFYATKTITTAEGGMVCTRDAEAAELMRQLRLHGMSRSLWNRYTEQKASWQYDIVRLGYKCNLPDILSAIGREQLRKAERFLEERRRIAGMYNSAFRGCDFLQTPPDGEGNAWHIYALRIRPEMLSIGRDGFARALQEKGIGISVHFIPLFHMTWWREHCPSLRPQNFPNAEDAFSRSISLPLWPGMTEAMTQRVIDAVIRTGKEHRA